MVRRPYDLVMRVVLVSPIRISLVGFYSNVERGSGISGRCFGIIWDTSQDSVV